MNYCKIKSSLVCIGSFQPENRIPEGKKKKKERLKTNPRRKRTKGRDGGNEEAGGRGRTEGGKDEGIKK